MTIQSARKNFYDDQTSMFGVYLCFSLDKRHFTFKKESHKYVVFISVEK